MKVHILIYDLHFFLSPMKIQKLSIAFTYMVIHKQLSEGEKMLQEKVYHYYCISLVAMHLPLTMVVMQIFLNLGRGKILNYRS